MSCKHEDIMMPSKYGKKKGYVKFPHTLQLVMENAITFAIYTLLHPCDSFLFLLHQFSFYIKEITEALKIVPRGVSWQTLFFSVSVAIIYIHINSQSCLAARARVCTGMHTCESIHCFILMTRTFRTVMTPSCVSFWVAISNISLPSPSTIRYSSSAFLPTSASEAFTLPMTVPAGEDSGIRKWTEPAKKDRVRKTTQHNVLVTSTRC